MPGMSDRIASRLYRLAFRGQRWPTPSARGLALLRQWQTSEIDQSSMLEFDAADAPGYPATRPHVDFEPPTRGRGTNTTNVSIGPASGADWPPALGMALCDDPSAGGVLLHGICRPGEVHDLRAKDGDTIDFPAGSIVADFCYRRLDEFRPWMHPDCWTWTNGGRQGENLILEHVGNGNHRIRRSFDLSVNGRDWWNDTEDKVPGFRSNVTVTEDSIWGQYHTFHPLIGVNEFEGGSNEVFGNVYHWDEPFVANGEFYTILVITNSRNDTNHRDLWGRFANDRVSFQQGSNGSVTIYIDGQSLLLVDKQLPKGLVVLEIWREGDNRLFARVNGQDVGVPGAQLAGTWTLDGFGEKGSGTSQFDDNLGEGGVFSTALDPETRDEIMTAVYEKWRNNFREWPQNGITAWLGDRIYDHLLRDIEFIPASERYLALTYRIPTLDDTGVSIDECEFAGYDRQLLAMADDVLEDGVGGNDSSHLWTPTAHVNRVVAGWVITDSPVRKAGNALAVGHFEGPPILKRSGEPIRIGRGDLTVNLNAN